MTLPTQTEAQLAVETLRDRRERTTQAELDQRGRALDMAHQVLEAYARGDLLTNEAPTVNWRQRYEAFLQACEAFVYGFGDRDEVRELLERGRTELSKAGPR